MPPRSAAPYLHCKQISDSMFSSTPGRISYKWHEKTSAQLGSAIELSDSFIIEFYQRIPKTDGPSLLGPAIALNMDVLDPTLDMLHHIMAVDTTLNHSIPTIDLDAWSKPLLLLSLEKFNLFDSLYSMHSLFILRFIDKIRILLKSGFTIGINFREVFFLKDNETPPSHFRDGIDIRVNNLVDFKRNVTTLSYQLAKSIMMRFSPDPVSIESSASSDLNNIIQQHYISKNAYITQESHPLYLNTSLNELQYFTSSSEASYYLRGVVNNNATEKCDHAILSFAPSVSIGDLGYLIKTKELHFVRELILIFHGDQYHDPAVRTQFYEDTLELIKKTLCRKILQIFLLTKNDINQNLLDLAPRTEARNETFSSLADDSGYYLSSVRVFSLIYRNIQTHAASTSWLEPYLTKANQGQQAKIKPIQTNAYIYNEAHPDFRQSKQLNKQALKTRISLSLNHQTAQTQVVNQEQSLNEELSQAQNITNQTTQTQHHHVTSSLLWSPQLDFDEFCRELQKKAKVHVEKRAREKLLEECGYFTAYYRKNRTEIDLLDQIACNDVIRTRIAKRIFGLAGPMQSFIHLQAYSIDGIRPGVADYIIDYVKELGDGFNPDDLERNIVHSRFLSSRTLIGFKYLSIKNTASATSRPMPVSSLAFNHNGERTGYQSHLNYYVLLTEDDLAILSLPQQTMMINLSQVLLGLFNRSASYDSTQIQTLETQFIELIRFYFKENESYLIVLKKFISMFEEHNEDNIKIMLQLIIQGYKTKIETFLKLLTYLDSRCFLKNFYIIYFKHAHNTFSVDNIISIIKNDPFEDIQVSPDVTVRPRSVPFFIELISRIPHVASSQDWPIFENFCYHILLFAAKNHMQITFSCRAFEQLWHRLHKKFLIYSELQEKEAQLLMERLVKNLITPEGLALAPVSIADTLFIGLEQLLDHAITKHTLREQIEEIGGVSLLWLDAPYASTHNGFQIVNSDMELHAEAMNPVTKRYSVSSVELKKALEHYHPGDITLKTSVFRYLGTEILREDLAFYRELHNKLNAVASSHSEASEQQHSNSQQDITTSYIYELLFGYFILTTTGIDYKPTIDQELFSKSFISFLNNHREAKKLPKKQVYACLDQFFEYAKHTTSDADKGTITLWGLWLKDNHSALAKQTTIIPDILTRKFDKHQLLRFIVTNSDAINTCLPLLHLQQDTHLAYSLIKALINIQFDGLAITQYKEHPLLLLQEIYPQLSVEHLINDIIKIASFIEHYSLLIQHGAENNLCLALHNFCLHNKNIDLVSIWVELLSNAMADHKTKQQNELSIKLLQALAQKQYLLTNVSQAKPLLALTITFYFDVQPTQAIFLRILKRCETLMRLNEESATQTLDVLLSALRTTGEYKLLDLSIGATTQQLFGMAKMIQHVNELSIAIPFIQLYLQAHPKDDFSEIHHILKDTTQEQTKHLLLLCNFICNDAPESVVEQLNALNNLPTLTITKLVRILELHTIEIQEIRAIIENPNCLDAIEQFNHEQNQKNLGRFDYDSNSIAEKISQIRLKSFTDDTELPLSTTAQHQLLTDYVNLMSYMTINPVLTEQDEERHRQSFTIQELNEQQFQYLVKHLKKLIEKNENKRPYQLMLLGLCCEALYRTTKKFPRYTQLLSIINSLNQKGDLINEIKTGGGKSIIATCFAILCEGTVDITTENDELAKDSLKKFRSFYTYLGIPCCSEIIEANSPHSTYVENGINYGTASSFSLFRMQMKLEKKQLPVNITLICDEIDATLTTTVQFRLATSLNPNPHDTKAWAFIYSSVLNFVEEREIFLENQCSKEDDINNLRHYLSLRSSTENIITLVNKLPNTLLETLIESALIAHQLEENIDYIVMTKLKEKSYHYAAPILASTNRPDLRISYANHLHQLLHTKLNQSPAKYPFEIEPSTETIVVISAKNFFDYYRDKGGRTIGLTGTAGSHIERKEFYQQNGLSVFSYPSFYDDQCQTLETVFAFGPENHQKTILEQIQEYKKISADQPFLIITDSPKATVQLSDYLVANTDWSIQTYHGYEDGKYSEEHVIYRAGMSDMVTIANRSLTRGADFSSTHPNGLFVINTCTDLTEGELRQIKGRTARDNQPGQFCSIINGEKLGTKTSTQEEITTLFKTHQHGISIKKQQERLKTRLLEEVRYHMISRYFLPLRDRADAILNRQFGLHSSLIADQDFLQTLSHFNQSAEQHYTELLDNNPSIDIKSDAANSFLQARVTEYQLALTKWLPNTHFQSFKAIEPLIPLDNLKPLTTLNAVTIDQFAILSKLLATGWKHVGHQGMQECFARLDQLLITLELYLKQKGGIQSVIAETLQTQNILSPQEALIKVDLIEEMLTDLTTHATTVPVMGYLVPKEKIIRFLTDYFNATKVLIQEKKWDELTLPKIDMASIGTWFKRLNTVASVSSLLIGGPIPFIVNKLVIPAIGTFIKSALKTSESNYLQILNGLTDITTDLSNFIVFLTSLSNYKKVTLGSMLDNITPLLKNRAFLRLTTKLLELTENAHLIPYLEAIPVGLTALEPYRESTLEKALNVQTLINFLQQCSQLDSIKNALSNTEFKNVLILLPKLTPAFLSTLSQLSFKEFINLLKVLAHPNFFNFLNALPPQTTFAELTRWVDAAPDAVPEEVQEPLTQLREYQSNRERIEADAEHTLRTLQVTFNLSVDKLKTELPKPHPISVPTPVEILDATQETSWLIYATISTCAALLILCNIFFFSVILLLTSIILVGLLAYPFIKEFFTNTPDMTPPVRQNDDTWSDGPAQPILVSASTHKVLSPEPIPTVSIDEQVNTIDVPTTLAGYCLNGFFPQSRARNAAPTDLINQPVSSFPMGINIVVS